MRTVKNKIELILENIYKELSKLHLHH